MAEEYSGWYRHEIWILIMTNLLFTNSGDKTNKTFLGLQHEVFHP